MCSSPEFIELKAPITAPTTGKMAGEKTSFSQTCNLLSQYLKEKRSVGDLNLGMACNGDGNGTGNGMPEMFLRQTATTMNLFPMTDKPASDDLMPNMVPPPSYRSMDLFPQQPGFPSTAREVVQKKVDKSVNKSGTQEPQTAQMTIFYGGKVIVFDDFPADKAKEVMCLASKGSSMSHAAHPLIPVQTHSPFAPNMPKPPVEIGSSIPSSSSDIDAPSFGSAQFQEEHVKRAVNAFPMARSASLQRFLAKRKDRIAVKAPYQTISPRSANSKAVEGMSWLGLAAQSPQ